MESSFVDKLDIISDGNNVDGEIFHKIFLLYYSLNNQFNNYCENYEKIIFASPFNATLFYG